MVVYVVCWIALRPDGGSGASVVVLSRLYVHTPKNIAIWVKSIAAINRILRQQWHTASVG